MDFNTQVHPSYLEGDVVKELQSSWQEQAPHRLLLGDFLEAGLYQSLCETISDEVFEQVIIPDRYSYKLLRGNHILKDFFSSNEFKEFVYKLTGVKNKKFNVEVRLYSWKDFTLLHDAESKKEHIEFFFFLPSLSEWDYFWGGTKIYQTERGEGQPLIFTPAPNTLGIISCSEGVFGFTQYLNHYVGDEQVLVVEGSLT